jgi:hypothetical protein
MPSRAQRLLDLGQSVWLDFIRRGHLVSGEFDRLVSESGVVGVTSNPTIFQQAIAQSHDYDEAISARIANGLEGPALFESLAVEDIQMACDRLRAVWEHTAHRDGRVSIEVSPPVAHDTEGTITEARRLHRSVARANLLVKVPATPEGSGDRGADRRRDQHQRDVISARPLPAGIDAYLRVSSDARRRARRWPICSRSPRSSSRAWTPRWTPRSRKRSPPSPPPPPRAPSWSRCAAKPRLPTRGSPTPSSRA